MASIERINFVGEVYEGVNVTKSVGLKGSNQRSDVMLIQALIRYIAGIDDPATAGEEDDFAKYTLGLNSASEIPIVTGICDFATLKAITAFQRRHVMRLLKVDGIIHPASYTNRYLKKPYPLMTITLLDMEARKTPTNIGGGDHIKGVTLLAPELRF